MKRNSAIIFVFDLDDTIVDTDSYSEKYILNYIKENNLPYKKISDVARFAEKKFSWDKETALKWYKEYGDQMMLEFPLRENAKEVVNGLYDQGHTIIISTARSTDWHSDPVGITKKWLEINELKYHKLYIGRSDKENVCKLENADVFLDDDFNIASRVGNYFSSSNKSKMSCLFTTKFNASSEVDKNVIRIKNFNDFLDKINLFIDSNK